MHITLILGFALTLCVTGHDQAVIVSRHRSESEPESSILRKTASQKSTQLKTSRLHLTELSPRTLTHVSQSMLLDLSFNYITHVDGDSFGNNAVVQEINLRGNEIADIAADVFFKTPLLSRLDLSQNKIRTLKSDVFANNRNLLLLNASRNNLESIHTKTFERSVDLEEVYLDSNALRFIDADTFVYCTKLRVINLSNNSIQLLPGGVFQKLVALEMVFLNKNSLTFMPREIFANNPKLRVVDLSENRLTYLGSSAFLGNRLLVSLRLENNPWTCDAVFKRILYSLQRKMRLTRVLGTVSYKDKEISLDNICPRNLLTNVTQLLQPGRKNNAHLQFSLTQYAETDSAMPNTTTKKPEEEDFLDSVEAEKDLTLILTLSAVAAMSLTFYASLNYFRRRRISKADQTVEGTPKKDVTSA